MTDARVEWVQDLADRTDPNLWEPVHEVTVDDRHQFARRPCLDSDGYQMYAPVADPWPLLGLSTIHGDVTTREARVRGGAGWLPTTWPRRLVEAPGQRRG